VDTKKGSKLKFFTFFLFCFIFSAWAFITPPGSGIDDDFHLPSIWCAQGDKTNICEVGKSGDLLGKVPFYVANAPFCIGYQPFNSGACTLISTNSTEGLVGARINESGLYMPNGYYYVNSLLISEDFYLSIWFMRLLNLVFFAILLGLTFLTKNKNNLKLLGWLIVINLNPLYFSILLSNNNSSWFFSSIIFLFFFLYTIFTSREKRDIIISIFALLLILTLALNSRIDNLPIYLIMIAISSFLIIPKKLIVSGITFISLAIFYVIYYSQIPGIGGFGIRSAFGSIDPTRDSRDVFLNNIVRLPTFFNGLIGGWGINWLDFYFPYFAIFLLQLSILLILILSIKQFNKTLILGLFSLLLTFGIYFWVLQIDLNLIGEMVQPRYLYPLFVFSLGLIIFSSDKILHLAEPLKIIIAALISIANGITMYYTIRRYTTGVDNRFWNLNIGVEWWPIPLPPMYFLILWSIGLFIAVFLLLKQSSTAACQTQARSINL
jgi:hypothetical protein